MFDEVLEEGYDISRPTLDDIDLDLVCSPSLKLLIFLLTAPQTDLPPNIKPSKVEKLIARDEYPSAWYTLFLAVLEARLAQYASSLEDDQQHLEVYKHRLQSGMWLTNQQETKRKYMALSVRVGEKEILRHAIGVLKAKVPATNGAAAKRKTSESRSGASTPKKARRG